MITPMKSKNTPSKNSKNAQNQIYINSSENGELNFIVTAGGKLYQKIEKNNTLLLDRLGAIIDDPNVSISTNFKNKAIAFLDNNFKESIYANALKARLGAKPIDDAFYETFIPSENLKKLRVIIDGKKDPDVDAAARELKIKEELLKKVEKATEEEELDELGPNAKEILQMTQSRTVSPSEIKKLFDFISGDDEKAKNLLETFNEMTSEEIDKVLEDVDVVLKKAETIKTMAATTPTAAVTATTAAVVDPESEPPKSETVETVEIENISQQKPLIKEQFVKRYHPNELRWVFGSSNDPRWDPALREDVINTKYENGEVLEKIKMILEANGKEIGIIKNKSETVEELNELIQLQWSICFRNLQIGPRFKTVVVKMSDIEKLQLGAKSVVSEPDIPQMNANGVNVVLKDSVEQVSDIPGLQSGVIQAEAKLQESIEKSQYNFQGRYRGPVGTLNRKKFIY